jgi:hypothetical protein
MKPKLPAFEVSLGGEVEVRGFQALTFCRRQARRIIGIGADLNKIRMKKPNVIFLEHLP